MQLCSARCPALPGLILAAAGCLLQIGPRLDTCLRWLTSAAWLLQRYRSLHAGNWSFQVRAIDDAGNYQNITAYPYATVNWTVALPSPYAEIQGGYTHEEGGSQVLSAACFNLGFAGRS